MKNITIILPIHRLEGTYPEMLKNAVSSIENFHNDVNLLLVCPNNLKDKLNNLSDKLDIKIITNSGKTDFCSQVNLGIDNCETEWFSILEIDDEFKPIWLKMVDTCIKENPDVDVFLPIVKDINSEGNFISFTNESVWAYGFSEVQGELDNEVLLEYQSYQISGGLYKTKKFLEVGGLKSNIKLTFGYELLLRLTHNGSKIVVIPRLGYRHVNLREDSLFWKYKNDETLKLGEKEAKFWIDTAKKEFFFTNKREVNYNEN